MVGCADEQNQPDSLPAESLHSPEGKKSIKTITPVNVLLFVINVVIK